MTGTPANGRTATDTATGPPTSAAPDPMVAPAHGGGTKSINSVDACARGQARLGAEERESTAGEVRARDAVLGEPVDFSRHPALLRVPEARVAPCTGDRFGFGLRLPDVGRPPIASRATTEP